MKLHSKKRQQGAVSILVALSLLALLAVVGLAIDSGLGYMIRAKLDAATDGAAIAAGQAVTRGADQTTQSNNAQQAANAFFAANYPAGFLGSIATLGTPSITFNQGTVTIDLAAQAQVPVTFMQLFGFNLLKVATTSEAVRKDLDMALIIDTTTSMADDPAVPPAVQAASITFLQQFDPLADRVSLLHFAYGTVVDVPFNGDARGFDLAGMTSKINHLVFSGSTNSSEAYWNALNQLQSVIKTPSSMRVIVFFSDGAPNSFTSIFGPNTKNTACNSLAGTIASPDLINPTTPASAMYYDNVQNQAYASPCFQNNAKNLITQLPQWYNAHNTTWLDNKTIPVITNTPRVVTNAVSAANVNNAARNIAEALANYARSQGIYVFAIGRGSELLQPEGTNGEIGQDVLKCMANTPDSLPRCYNPAQPVGVYCQALTPADLAPCFSKLASEILRISK